MDHTKPDADAAGVSFQPLNATIELNGKSV